MAQMLLPGRLGRLQEAEARRLELEEAKRQEIGERSERKKHEAALARQAREAADLEREAEAMESAVNLRSKWEQADKNVAKVKNAFQRAAAERVAGWQKRRDNVITRLVPETLFDRLRRQMEEDGQTPTPEEPAVVKEASPMRKSWIRPSSARILPNPPQELVHARTQSSAVRAQYDGQENFGIIQRRLAEVQRAAEEAKRQSMFAANEELVQKVRWMLQTRQLRRGWAKLKELGSLAKKTRWVQQMVRRILNQELVRFWNSWADMTWADTRTYKAMEKVALAFMHRRLMRGWLGWYSVYADGMHNDKVRDAMRGAITRMLNRQLSMCFETWQAITEDAMRAREAMGQVIRALINRHLKRGWLGWHALYMDKVRERYAMRGVVTRMLNRQLSMCFETWQAITEAARHAHEATDRAIRAFMNRDLKRGWLGWHALYMDKVRERYAMRGVVARMLNRDLSRCWEAWAQVLADAQRQHDIMEHVAKSFINRHVKRGFLGWHDAHMEVLRAKAKMRHAIMLLVKRQLAQGWRHWLSIWLPDRAERLAQRREQERIERETKRAMARQARLERIKALRSQQLLARYQEDMELNASMLVLAKTGFDAKRLHAKRDVLENRPFTSHSWSGSFSETEPHSDTMNSSLNLNLEPWRL